MEPPDDAADEADDDLNVAQPVAAKDDGRHNEADADEHHRRRGHIAGGDRRLQRGVVGTFKLGDQRGDVDVERRGGGAEGGGKVGLEVGRVHGGGLVDVWRGRGRSKAMASAIAAGATSFRRPKSFAATYFYLVVRVHLVPTHATAFSVQQRFMS